MVFLNDLPAILGGMAAGGALFAAGYWWARRRRAAGAMREDHCFIYEAAHDLKAPLRAIMQVGGVLRADLNDRMTAEQCADFSLILQRAERMHRLIDDLLTYWQSEHDPVSPDNALTDIEDVVREGIALLVLPEHFHIELQCDEPVAVRRLPLLQVLGNLLENAVKYNDKENGIIALEARAAGRWCIITIDDNGPGIPACYRAQVFRLFEKLESRDRIEGSGIGLALVNQLCRRVRATISLADSPYEGLRVIVKWPLGR